MRILYILLVILACHLRVVIMVAVMVFSGTSGEWMFPTAEDFPAGPE